MGWWPFGNKKAPVDEVGSAAKQKQEACPYCPGMRDPQMTPQEFEAYLKSFDKLDEMVNDGKYSAVLKRIDELLPKAPLINHDMLAYHITECFEGLCDGKKPQAILDFYDKYFAEGLAVPFAAKHGQMKDMAWALSRNLENYPEVKTKAALKKVVDFVLLAHPLMEAARETAEDDVVDFLDGVAENMFEQWQTDQSDDLQGIIADIEAISAGRPQQGRTLDPNALNCSCREWTAKRSKLALDDPSRLCSHLTRYFAENQDKIPAPFLPYLAFVQGRGANDIGMPLAPDNGKIEYGSIDDEPYILTMNRDSPWVNIRLPGNSEYAFNVKEKRWSKAGEPKNTATLAKKAIALKKG